MRLEHAIRMIYCALQTKTYDMTVWHLYLIEALHHSAMKPTAAWSPVTADPIHIPIGVVKYMTAMSSNPEDRH
jgi:hypothetical protein